MMMVFMVFVCLSRDIRDQSVNCFLFAKHLPKSSVLFYVPQVSLLYPTRIRKKDEENWAFTSFWQEKCGFSPLLYISRLLSPQQGFTSLAFAKLFRVLFRDDSTTKNNILYVIFIRIILLFFRFLRI